MDQTDQNQPITNHSASAAAGDPGIISDSQKQTFISELGLDSLPEDQKTDLVNTMMETVLNRIFTRISPVLTDQDAAMIETLQSSGDNADQTVIQYLGSKVPNLTQIVNEEIESFKAEMKQDLANIQTSLNQ